MGCPDRYYKEALQAFACSLNRATDKKRANLLYKEESTSVLEKEILDLKNKFDTKHFYYCAGCATEHILTNADRYDGCDGFNACIGGLAEFQDFIGINSVGELL